MTQPIAFDADAECVLQTAREIATIRGEPNIAPHVLLAALARAGGPVVQRALSRYELGPEQVKTWLEAAVGSPRDPEAFQANAPHSLRTSAILDAAQAEASEAGRDDVAPADLLVGILREPHAPSGLVANVLLHQGATYDGVRSALSP